MQKLISVRSLSCLWVGSTVIVLVVAVGVSIASAAWEISTPLEKDSIATNADFSATGEADAANVLYVIELRKEDNTIAQSHMGQSQSDRAWGKHFTHPNPGWLPTGTGWKLILRVGGTQHDSCDITVNP